MSFRYNGWNPKEVFRLRCVNEKEEREMLVLTRRIGEMVRIGEDVNVTVLGIQNGQVRIGIAAPREVSVHREEIFQRIQKEKLDRLEDTLEEEEEEDD